MSKICFPSLLCHYVFKAVVHAGHSHGKLKFGLLDHFNKYIYLGQVGTEGDFQRPCKALLAQWAWANRIVCRSFPRYLALGTLICIVFLWSTKFFHVPKSLGWPSYRTFFLWVSSSGHSFDNLYCAFMSISEPWSMPPVVIPLLDNARPAKWDADVAGKHPGNCLTQVSLSFKKIIIIIWICCFCIHLGKM